MTASVKNYVYYNRAERWTRRLRYLESGTATEAKKETLFFCLHLTEYCDAPSVEFYPSLNLLELQKQARQLASDRKQQAGRQPWTNGECPS
ncbi:hypothetical protein NEUTE2DRAFT_60401 [Neurospora tetrasperma FGSC 2509]|nr:hypothetical protein NEUTE2DRAFT_60401 [Neurospora tetrasperma FGSC 2509]